MVILLRAQQGAEVGLNVGVDNYGYFDLVDVVDFGDVIVVDSVIFFYSVDVIVCVVVDVDDVAGATRCQSRPLCRGCLQTPPTPRVRCPSIQDSGI